MSEGWLPLSARENSGAAEEFLAPYEGVPPHLQPSLTEWTSGFFPTDRLGLGDSLEELRRLERTLHVQYRVSGDPRRTIGTFLAELSADPNGFLNVVDALLTEHGAIWPQARLELEEILSQSGSVWMVAQRRNGWGLQRRVNAELREIASLAMKSDDNGSQHIGRAWEEAFGLSPNPSSAYHEVVCALEATLQPILSPKNEKATLGTIVADIRNAPNKFVANLDGKGEGPEGVEAIRGLLSLIWRTEKRHGSALDGVPTSNTLEQARDAVVLGTALVQLVRQEGFRVASSSPPV